MRKGGLEPRWDFWRKHRHGAAFASFRQYPQRVTSFLRSVLLHLVPSPTLGGRDVVASWWQKFDGLVTEAGLWRT